MKKKIFVILGAIDLCVFLVFLIMTIFPKISFFPFETTSVYLMFLTLAIFFFILMLSGAFWTFKKGLNITFIIVGFILTAISLYATFLFLVIDALARGAASI